MSEDLFLKIIKGEIPSEKVYEDEYVYAFRDIYPQAKEHYLFIAKEKTRNVNEMTLTKPEQFTQIFSAIQKFTKESGLEESGFRIVTNTNKNAGQTVFHTHFHVLGGEALSSFGS